MSLLQDSQIENSVYLCSFQCTIRQANISMKFPCSYFVEWSTSSRKAIATSNKHLPQQQGVHFDQKIILQTQMVYNNKSSQYSKKETLVQLYLVSKSRPDQNKLVGRVSIDLAKVINFQMYAQPTQFTLNFCSVQGSLTMQFHILDQKLTTMKMHELDKSSFIDFISQIALKNPKSNSSIKSKENVVKQKESSLISKHVEQLKIKMAQRNDITDLQQNMASNPLNGSNVRTSSKKTIQKVENNIQTKKINFQSQKIAQKNIQEKPIAQLPNPKPIQIEGEIKSKTSLSSKKLSKTQSNIVEHQEIGIFYQQAHSILPLKTSQFKTLKESIVEVRDDKQKALELQKKLRDNEIKVQEEIIDVVHEVQQIQSLKQQRNILQKLVFELQQKQKNAYQQIQYLNLQISTKNNIIKQLSSELNQREQRCEELMQMVSSLNQQKNHKESPESGTSEKEILYLQQIVHKFQKEVQKLNVQLQEAQKNGVKNQQKFIDLEHLIQALQLQNAQLKDQLRKDLQIRQKLESKLTEYEDIVKQQTNNYKQIQIKLIQTQKKYQKAKDQFENNQKQHLFEIDQFSLKTQSLKYDLERAKQLNMEYQSQNQKNLQLCDQKQSQILDLNILVEEYKNKEVTRSKLVQVIQNSQKIIQLQDQNKRISEEVEFLKQSLEMLQRQTNQEIQMLKNQKNKYQTQLQKIKTQHQDRQTFETQRQVGTEQILSNASKQINAYKQELLNLANELAIQKQYNQQIIFQIKSLQNQKSSLIQQGQKYQAQIVQLHQELRAVSSPKNNKISINKQQNVQEKIDEYEMRISKLNANLEEQINNNNQLSQTIVNYMQKQAKMKETLNVLEEESKEIFVLFQEKEHNEETYQKMIEDLQKQIQRLSTNFYQIHSQELSPKKNLQRTPSLTKLKQKLQNNSEELTQTNRKLQQLNEQLNEQLLKLKIMYNNLKEQSENQIKKLNQQIIEVQGCSKKETTNQKYNQMEKSLKAKDLELQIHKSKLKQAEESKMKLEKQLEEAKKHMQTLEEQKFDIQSSLNEKDIKILQLNQEIFVLKNAAEMARYQPSQTVPKQNQQLLTLLPIIKQKLTNKNIQSDWQQMIQNILQKSLCGQDTSKLINIEQKSRLLSKQLQKLKAHILKSALKNQQQKLSFMNLIKTCESIVVQIIAAAESLSLNQSSFL